VSGEAVDGDLRGLNPAGMRLVAGEGVGDRYRKVFLVTDKMQAKGGVFGYSSKMQSTRMQGNVLFGRADGEEGLGQTASEEQ